MNLLSILEPVIRRAEASKASVERKRRWRQIAENAKRERRRDSKRAKLNWKLYRSNKKAA